MGRFATLVSKDIKVITRNRALLVTLVLYPLLMVGVLGLVFAKGDTPMSVALVIGSEGNTVPANATFGGAIITLDSVTEKINAVARAVEYPDRESAEEALRNSEVDAIIDIPDFFLTDLLFDFRNQAQLTVILDGSDPAKSAVAESVIIASIHQFNQDIVAYKVAETVALLDIALNGDPSIPSSFRKMLDLLRDIQENEQLSGATAIRVQDAIAFLEFAIGELEQGSDTINSIALPIEYVREGIDSGVLDTRDIVVPAAVALSIFWTGILASASLVVYERQSNAQLRLNVSPVSMGTIVASKLSVAAAIIVIQSLLIITAAKLAWDIRLDNPPLLLAMLAAGAFAAVGLGLLVAGLSRDTNGSTLLSVLAVFPMMFLSGLFFPISFMPEAAQRLAMVMPLTYAVDGLRGAMLRGYEWHNAQVDLAVLIALGALALIIGFVRNRALAREA